MPLRTDHHHSFTVSNADRSIGFYRDLLGLQLIQDAVRENLESYDRIVGFQNARLRIAMLRLATGDFILELIEYLNPPGQVREMRNYYAGASHICFLVDDIDREYERLSAAGVRFNSPPVDIIRDGKLVTRCLYMLDPDGITVELDQPA
jgi:catechol 2,3-dioxygenase-like lactoylglutathione lyase family enzyme